MVSDGFAGLLKARRSRFNAAVAAVRSRSGGFDTAELNRFLTQTVDPLWTAMRTADEGRAGAAGEALFDMALTLVEHRWTGAGGRSPLVERLWRNVGPELAAVLAPDPLERLGVLTNAAIKLSQQRGVAADLWCAELARVGPQTEGTPALRRLAIVAAWRAGAAYARSAALDAAEALPPALACEALGGEARSDRDDLVRKLREDRWWSPKGRFAGERRAGGFTGFGGPFGEPPRLAVDGEDFLVVSGGRCFRLEADAYGASLRSVGSDRPPSRLAHAAETSDSVAVASPTSHFLRVRPA